MAHYEKVAPTCHAERSEESEMTRTACLVT